MLLMPSGGEANQRSSAGATSTQQAPGDALRHGPLASLCLVARLHHIAAEPSHLAHQLGWPASHVVQLPDLILAARHLGLKAKLSRSSADRLTRAPLPALAVLRAEGEPLRVVVLAQCDGQRVLFQDPSESIQGGRPVIEPIAAFVERWTGELLLVASRASLAGQLARFDFSWFIPSLVKYRRLFGEVLIVSLFLQLFALVSPLFFQVVMDKVLVHRGLTTLDVLVIGLSVIVLFESLLTVLRTFVSDQIDNTIRKISPTGTISLLAGASGLAGSTDGMGAAARFDAPGGLAVDAAGNVYVADLNNLTIRKITPSGLVSTLAGTAGVAGNVDGTGATALFSQINGLAVDAEGNVYATDFSTIRRITSAGVVTAVAGTPGQSGWNGDGALPGLIRFPMDIAIAPSGYLVVTAFNAVVRIGL